MHAHLLAGRCGVSAADDQVLEHRAAGGSRCRHGLCLSGINAHSNGRPAPFRSDPPRGSRGRAAARRVLSRRRAARRARQLPARQGDRGKPARDALRGLVDCAFVGEETGSHAGLHEPAGPGSSIPHDGTVRSSSPGGAARRSRSRCCARACRCSAWCTRPMPPDRGADTIAWAEGAQLQRNGKPLQVDLSQRKLAPGEFVLATASTVQRPQTWSRGGRAGALHRRCRASPTAWRASRPATAWRRPRPTASTSTTIAAGMALIGAARGVVARRRRQRDARCRATPRSASPACYAGAPEAAAQLARFDWTRLDAGAAARAAGPARLSEEEPGQRLARAQGAMLGQVIGDSLGACVEVEAGERDRPALPARRARARRRRRLPPDGGPADRRQRDGADARAQHRARRANSTGARCSTPTAQWITSRPVDVGMTTEKGLIGAERPALGIERLADALLADRRLGGRRSGARCAHRARRVGAHPSATTSASSPAPPTARRSPPASAARAAKTMLEAAVQHSKARRATRRSAARRAAGRRTSSPTRDGCVLSLQNAFYCLMNMDIEEALVSTVAQGGDTDTNAAIAGRCSARRTAAKAFRRAGSSPSSPAGRSPSPGALRPRPIEYWPDDILELSEALLPTSGAKRRS